MLIHLWPNPKKNGTKLGKFNLIPLLRCRIRILQCFFGLISQRSYSFFRVICVVTFTHGASPTTTPLRRRRGARFEEGPDWKGLSFAIISLSHIYIYIIPFTSYIIHILYYLILHPSSYVISYITSILIWSYFVARKPFQYVYICISVRPEDLFDIYLCLLHP